MSLKLVGILFALSAANFWGSYQPKPKPTPKPPTVVKPVVPSVGRIIEHNPYPLDRQYKDTLGKTVEILTYEIRVKGDKPSWVYYVVATPMLDETLPMLQERRTYNTPYTIRLKLPAGSLLTVGVDSGAEVAIYLQGRPCSDTVMTGNQAPNPKEMQACLGGVK
jgi:hypothetical protein